MRSESSRLPCPHVSASKTQAQAFRKVKVFIEPSRGNERLSPHLEATPSRQGSAATHFDPEWLLVRAGRPRYSAAATRFACLEAPTLGASHPRRRPYAGITSAAGSSASSSTSP